MSKDLTNLRKWFKDLGLEIDEQLDNDVLKKLIPPQRRDMWRTVMKHVLPETQVELIKKTILLHKLQTRNKPLMAKVECDEDLKNALKYEELIMKYDKIQNDISVAKKNNHKLKMDLEKKYIIINKTISTIENQQCAIYLSKHKTAYYKKCIEELHDKTALCDYFSTKVNAHLTQTDYEDALIVCFASVDEAKTCGIMNQTIKVGKSLCNTIYNTIKEKSPKDLILTIEKNISDHLRKNQDFLIETKLVVHESDDEKDNNNECNEIHSNFIQKQLDLKLKLSNTLNEKEDNFKHFQEKVILVQNEIIGQYKLNNIFFNDEDLVIFKQKLKDTFNTIIKKSIDCTMANRVDNNSETEIFNINHEQLLDKIQVLNEDINQKQTLIQNMLNEILRQKEGFGLIEIKSIYETTAEDYLKENENFQIDKKLFFLKYISSIDIFEALKSKPNSVPKLNVHFQTLQDINKYSKIIDVINEFSAKLNEFNNFKSDENNFNEIKQKENAHKMEFERVLTHIKNTMSVLNSSIKNCKIISETSVSFK